MRNKNKILKRTFIAATTLCALGATCLVVNSFDAKAVEENITVTSGASVKIDNPSGIRFQGVLDETAANALFDISGEEYTLKTGAEVGMIVVPAQALATIESNYFVQLKSLYNKDKKDVSDYVGEDKITKESNGTYTYTCSIVSILPENYAYNYQAVAYYTTDGTNYHYSAKSDVKNILEVADYALTYGGYEDDSAEKTTLLSMVSNYLTKANADYAISFAKGDTATLADEIVGLGQITGATYAVKEGENEAVVSETDGVLSASGYGGGETVLTMSAYGGALTLDIPTTVTDVQTVETDISTGFAFDSVASAMKGETELTVTDGKVVLEKTTDMNYVCNAENNLTSVEYVLNHTDGTTTTLNATVYAKIIKTVDDLMTANESGYLNGTAYYGSYKLAANIDMSGQTWAVENAIGYASGRSVYSQTGIFFDGNGYSIDNFAVTAEKASLFWAVSYNSLVKNLKMMNASTNSGWSRSSVVAFYSYIGTLDNLYINVGSYSSFVWTGLLVGQQYGATKISNTTVISDYTDKKSQYDVSAALVGSASGEMGALILENVTVVGFNDNVISNNGTLLTKDTAVQANWTNLQVLTKEEYTTALSAVVTDLDADAEYTRTIDFATYMPQGATIASVSIDGVAIEGTSVVYTKETASNEAHSVFITDTDGKMYSIALTVWSKIINTAADLQAADNYGYYTADADGSVTNYAYYGYFTLGGNIDMSGVTWNSSMMIARTNSCGENEGFMGVFDGAGYAIQNFAVNGGEHTGLIHWNGLGIIRNLTVENASVSSANSGVLIGYAFAGTIENVTVEVNSLASNDTSALIGRVYNISGGSVALTIKGVDVIWTGDGDTETGSAITQVVVVDENAGTYHSRIVLEDVTVVGVSALFRNYLSMSTAITNDAINDESSVYTTWKDKVTYYTVEAWEALQTPTE